MKIISPKYYKDFKCIDKNCKHNCCIGWEIDIDSNTYDKYKNMKDEFGKTLNNNITFDGEIASFKLLDNERCPFLNDNNLCDIIINLGEDSLCQICNDHPRFRNFYSDRTEIGIGICCEEACKLIVTQKEPLSLIQIDNNDEKSYPDEVEIQFFNMRNDIFNLLCESNNLKDTIKEILSQFNIKFPRKTLNQWINIYSQLEIMDENWIEQLNILKTKKIRVSDHNEYDIAFKNLFYYFIYRHLGECIYDENFNGRLLFSVLSCYIIHNICFKKFKNKINIDNIIEIARMYSAEIEYSSENFNTLIELLQRESLRD